MLQAKGWWGKQLVEDPATGDLVAAQLGRHEPAEADLRHEYARLYAAGHWTSFERNKAARPYLRYVALLDDRTRPAHRARHNLVLPVDHPILGHVGAAMRLELPLHPQQTFRERDVDRLQRQGEDLQFEPPQDRSGTSSTSAPGR